MSDSQLAFANGFRRLAVLVLLGTSWSIACRSTPPPPTPVSPDTWAVVDGRDITREQVDKAYSRVRDASQMLSPEEEMAAKLALLNELIVQDILLAKASTLKVELPASDLDTAYSNAQKNITPEAFKQELSRRGMTEADLREGLRRELLAQKVIEQEVGSKVTVSDQEVTDFFNANQAQFNLAEDSYHLAQIIVTPVRDQQLANRTGDDAVTPQAAAAKVSMLMERLKGGTPFGDLARDYSEDPESAPRGGDLGLVPVSAVKQAPPALRDAVLNVPPGSARVVTQNGAHSIVFVVAKEDAGQRQLTTPGVRERITEGLRGRKEQLLRAAYLTAIRSDAQVVNHLARRVVESKGAVPAQ
jgi:peptidyl-prolyl cis-trans isomerase SurA